MEAFPILMPLLRYVNRSKCSFLAIWPRKCTYFPFLKCRDCLPFCVIFLLFLPWELAGISARNLQILYLQHVLFGDFSGSINPISCFRLSAIHGQSIKTPLDDLADMNSQGTPVAGRGKTSASSPRPRFVEIETGLCRRSRLSPIPNLALSRSPSLIFLPIPSPVRPLDN